MDAIELLKKARCRRPTGKRSYGGRKCGTCLEYCETFNGRGYDPEDLFQIGCIGLIKSIDHFNLDFESGSVHTQCP